MQHTADLFQPQHIVQPPTRRKTIDEVLNEDEFFFARQRAVRILRRVFSDALFTVADLEKAFAHPSVKPFLKHLCISDVVNADGKPVTEISDDIEVALVDPSTPSDGAIVRRFSNSEITKVVRAEIVTMLSGRAPNACTDKQIYAYLFRTLENPYKVSLAWRMRKILFMLKNEAVIVYDKYKNGWRYDCI